MSLALTLTGTGTGTGVGTQNGAPVYVPAAPSGIEAEQMKVKTKKNIRGGTQMNVLDEEPAERKTHSQTYLLFPIGVCACVLG